MFPILAADPVAPVAAEAAGHSAAAGAYLMQPYLWVIPAAPLAAFLIVILFGRGVLKERAHLVSITGTAIALVASVLTFLDITRLPDHGAMTTRLFTWMDTGRYAFDPLHLDVGITLRADHLTGVMLLVVTSVGLLVHIYSVGYMHGDTGYYRFFAYLPLFVFSMLMLVLADSYLLLFVFWEAVGMCSYFLIGFWFHRESANRASMKAFITNRVGDVGFGLGTMLVFVTFGTFEYAGVFERLEQPNHGGIPTWLITTTALLLFCGAIGKSAMVPLHVWLPDAMEGPTPVSALIHAATMVTAGIYLVARSWPMYDASEPARNVIAVIGVFTAFMAATIALVQRDIKRVLAYSTLSQLGYMCFALGVGAYIPAIFHLMTHAMFKGLLFLGSGSVIHGMHEEQDIFKMGGLRKQMPITAYTFLIGSLAIAGVTGLSGFWSKDEIIVGAYHAGYPVIAGIGLLVAALTAFYMFRLYFLTFEGKPRYDTAQVHPHESPATMTMPLLVLAVPSIVIGALVGYPPENGLFHKFLHKTIGSELLEASGPVEFETTLIFGVLSSVAAIFGIGLAYLMYVRQTPNPYTLGDRLHGLWTFLYKKWYFDEVYNALFIGGTRQAAHGLWWVDANIIDGAVNGIARSVNRSSGQLRRVQTGFVANYALVIALGMVLIVGVFLIARSNLFALFG